MLRLGSALLKILFAQLQPAWMNAVWMPREGLMLGGVTRSCVLPSCCIWVCWNSPPIPVTLQVISELKAAPWRCTKCLTPMRGAGLCSGEQSWCSQGRIHSAGAMQAPVLVLWCCVSIAAEPRFIAVGERTGKCHQLGWMGKVPRKLVAVYRSTW